MTTGARPPLGRVLGRARRTVSGGPASPQRVPGVLSEASERWALPIPPADPSVHGPRIVLLNECRDQVNFGAQALVEGLLRILQRSLPGATIVPIPSHWLLDMSAERSAFVGDGAGLRAPKAVYPRVADQFETLGDDWLAGEGGRDASSFLRRFEGADLVFLNGEGSLYRTNLSAIRELFLAWLAKERLSIPTVFANGMVHLTDVVPVLPAMVRKTFPALDGVAVREPCSLRNLALHVPDVKAVQFPDSAFVLGHDEARRTPAVEAVLHELGATPYFCLDPGPMPLDVRGGERSALHQLLGALSQLGVRPVVVSSAPADRSIEAAARAAGALYVDTIVDHREYMALVGGARFVVTGRYHNPILAALVGCPSITLASTSHKVHGACEVLEGAIGAPHDGTDLRRNLGAILDQAHRYVANRDELGQRLLELCALRREEAWQLGTWTATRTRPCLRTAGRFSPPPKS